MSLGLSIRRALVILSRNCSDGWMHVEERMGRNGRETKGQRNYLKNSVRRKKKKEISFWGGGGDRSSWVGMLF